MRIINKIRTNSKMNTGLSLVIPNINLQIPTLNSIENNADTKFSSFLN